MLIPVAELPRHPRLGAAALVVVAFCADWCGTCREFRPVLERIAAAHPEWLVAWADIEDDAELVGDIDVDNFPTLAVFRDGRPLHFGVSLPHENLVDRLLQSIARSGAMSGDVPDEIREFGGRLAR